MARKRLTQLIPALLPLRRWQRKKFFYLKMKFDGCRYATNRSEKLMENKVFETSSTLINQNSGFDIQYQLNKVHNLKLAAQTIDGIIIRPQETFSFWLIVRHADDYVRYKEGLSNIDGITKAAYGGGLCQLSNMLLWMFLHGPFEIVERTGHDERSFPLPDDNLPEAIDATVSEGWLDLKVRNIGKNAYQLHISFDKENMYGELFCEANPEAQYQVFNPYVRYVKKSEQIYQETAVCRRALNNMTGEAGTELMYENKCEILYKLDENTAVEEEV